MIVVVILGILAAIAVPNFVSMQTRAKEGYLKTNMHTFQMTVEDYGVRNDGVFASDAVEVAALLPTIGASNLRNPFNHLIGENEAWENRGSMLADPTNKPGITSYADSSNRSYNVKGFGHTTVISIVLSSGQ